MIISITRIDRGGDAPVAGGGHSGFTLVEIMVALALSTLVMAGVMSSFLMLGRTDMNIAHYSIAQAEIDRGLEEFSQDVRMASDVTWNNSTSVTLTVPDNYSANSNKVTYVYDSAAAGPTARSFYRMPGTPASPGAKTILVREISSFYFSRYNRLNVPAATDPETKRIQVTMRVRRTRATLVAANAALVSASYTLRNKPVN